MVESSFLKQSVLELTFPAFHYLTPSLCSRPEGDNHHIMAAFAIDAQGQIAYTSTHKKGVFIHNHSDFPQLNDNIGYFLGTLSYVRQYGPHFSADCAAVC